MIDSAHGESYKNSVMDQASPENLWNSLASRFAYKKEATSPGSLENILFLWPFILKSLDDLNGKKVMDFGCGTGTFCQELHRHGAKVSGLDSSSQMLSLARQESPEDISYFKNFQEIEGQIYDCVTSIHALEFVKDADFVLRNILNTLKPKGILCFATHTPEFIEARLEKQEGFGRLNTKEVYKNFNGVKVPIYMRSVQEYDQLLKSLNFTRIAISYPEYSSEFKKQYNLDKDLNNWAMVMTYKKAS